jgi:hypothetical protein
VRPGTGTVNTVGDITAVVVAALLVLLIIAIAIVVEIARCRVRGELTRALAVQQVTSQQMDPVHRVGSRPRRSPLL